MTDKERRRKKENDLRRLRCIATTVSLGRRRSTPTPTPTPTPAVTTWSPTDKSANVTLSNGNLTMASPSGAGSVRSTNALLTKTYVEIVKTNFANYPIFGLAAASMALSAAPGGGGSVNSIGTHHDGNVYKSGSGTSILNYAGGASTGSRYGIAYDPFAALVWMRLDGGPWFGQPPWNPATGVGGITTADLVGALFIAAYGNGSGDSWTLRTSAAAMVDSIPSGFSAPDA